MMGRYPCRYCCWSTAKSIAPLWISLTTPALRSKVAILAFELAPATAASTMFLATSGSRARMASMLVSALSAACSVAVAEETFDLALSRTRSFSLPPKPVLAPAQRSRRLVLVASWITQRRWVPPSAFKRTPACWPAAGSRLFRAVEHRLTVGRDHQAVWLGGDRRADELAFLCVVVVAALVVD